MMKTNLHGFRVVRAALLPLALAVTALAIWATPALAVTASAVRIHGRGLALPVHGGGSLSFAGVLVVVAVVAATIAFGVIGWRRDQRGVALARSQQPGSPSGAGEEPRETHKPLASKPLGARNPARNPADVRARRGHRSDDQGDSTKI
jgi:hypothetical protein